MSQILHRPLYFKFNFLIIFLFITNFLFSQGEANIWYFGHQAGLDFNSGSPVALTNSKMVTDEGSASISDASGKLLFYTDGTAVWNSLHDTMQNGFDLYGDPSSTQSAVIIQKPGSSTIYYIFTADADAGTKGLCYSEVNMSFNGGLGKVTLKNQLLYSKSCEKITGVRHCNNSDIWVITHDNFTNVFRSFKVSASGVESAGVTTAIGPIIAGGTLDYAGQLKASLTGKKVVMANAENGTVSLFDFDQKTGILSNWIEFSGYKLGGQAYGAEFSPDASKLYVATYGTPVILYQMNLCAGDSLAIADSPIIISIPIPSSGGGSLQLGPDKKIYMAEWSHLAGAVYTSISVINNPNNLGASCGFMPNSIYLNGKLSGCGLPNFVPYNLKTVTPPYTYTINCLNGLFAAPIVNLITCSSSTNAVVSQVWNFGDQDSGNNNTSALANPTHTFSNAGTYTVSLTLNYTCGSDVLTQTVVAIGPKAKAESDATIKQGESVKIQAIGNGSFLWNTGETTSLITVSPSSTTVYCFTVTDAFNCKNDACATITVTIPIEIPNVFSPNGDGINDVWNLNGITTYAHPEVSIYNRWGQPILFKSDYNIPWDGTHKGIALPTASYYYVININNGEYVFSGYVTLKR